MHLSYCVYILTHVSLANLHTRIAPKKDLKHETRLILIILYELPTIYSLLNFGLVFFNPLIIASFTSAVCNIAAFHTAV